LQSADGPLGQFARKWIPVARNMSTNSGHLRNKYLTENFERHTDCIKHKIKNQKISLVFNESLDISGRKTVNTLCSFYDENIKTKSILLIDCSVLKIFDHNSFITLTNSILKTYEKFWSDVIAISTDSASYALKYAQVIKETQNFNIHHINDISHLIHVAVIHGFRSNKMRVLREIIISFGNLFLNANKMNEEFNELLEKKTIPIKKPQQVVDHRLFSYYRTSLDIIELWSYLCDFINTYKFSSRKVESIKVLLGNDLDKMLVFVTLNGIVDF
jgi:hypothetical protein